MDNLPMDLKLMILQACNSADDVIALSSASKTMRVMFLHHSDTIISAVLRNSTTTDYLALCLAYEKVTHNRQPQNPLCPPVSRIKNLSLLTQQAKLVVDGIMKLTKRADDWRIEVRHLDPQPKAEMEAWVSIPGRMLLTQLFYFVKSIVLAYDDRELSETCEFMCRRMSDIEISLLNEIRVFITHHLDLPDALFLGVIEKNVVNAHGSVAKDKEAEVNSDVMDRFGNLEEIMWDPKWLSASDMIFDEFENSLMEGLEVFDSEPCSWTYDFEGVGMFMLPLKDYHLDDNISAPSLRAGSIMNDLWGIGS